MQSINCSYNCYREEYDEHAKLLIKKLLAVVVTYGKYLTQLGEITGFLDAMVGLATAAISSSEPWVKPEFSENKKIEILELRHPLLENCVEFVPNDVILNEEQRLMILTGPNMGGKSTYLRSVAVAVIMAQIGSFIPCKSAQIPICDAIIARIGASDNLQRGVSTFFHEMSECESIFRTATEKSFVIVDELGRGTSTWDGFGIAWSIADAIINKVKCLGLFATHYHEMAALKTKCPAAFNMHTNVFVDGENKKITHLYTVESGPCSKSYGIEIAQMAKFPENVLKRARDEAEIEGKNEKIFKKGQEGLNFKIREDAAKELELIIKKFKNCDSNQLKNKKEEIFKIAKATKNSIIENALQC